MSATQQTLAQMVRAKYPHAYDDIDDASLEKSVLSKHPEYSDLPQTKSTMSQKAESWWNTPTEETPSPQDVRGAAMAGKSLKTTDTPRNRFRSEMATLSVPGAALGIPEAIASPGAAALSVAGAVGGGVVGGKVGEYAGEKAGAPTLGGDVGGLVGSFFGGMSGPAAVRLRTLLSKSIYTPTGELTPLAKAAVHPTELPEMALRKAIPPPPEGPTFPGASEPSSGEFYENKAQELTKRGQQQDIIDRRAAVQQRLADRQAAVAAKNAPKPSPFEGATSTAPTPTEPPKIETDSLGIRWAVAADGKRVTIPKSVSDADAASYAAPKLAEQRQIHAAIKGDIPQGSTSPFTSTNPKYQNLSDLRGTAPDDLISRTKTLVRPGEAPSAADLKRAGDLTQVPLAKLKQLAQWGDELAKNEIMRRLRQ